MMNHHQEIMMTMKCLVLTANTSSGVGNIHRLTINWDCLLQTYALKLGIQKTVSSDWPFKILSKTVSCAIWFWVVLDCGASKALERSNAHGDLSPVLQPRSLFQAIAPQRDFMSDQCESSILNLDSVDAFIAPINACQAVQRTCRMFWMMAIISWRRQCDYRGSSCQGYL